jgi:hypothetical protein
LDGDILSGIETAVVPSPVVGLEPEVFEDWFNLVQRASARMIEVS